MATISHDPVASAEKRPTWIAALSITEMWASLAIVVIWLAVLFAAVYAPDITSHGAGGDSITIPAGVGVALFASIATWAVAKYGLRHNDRR